MNSEIPMITIDFHWCYNHGGTDASGYVDNKRKAKFQLEANEGNAN